MCAAPLAGAHGAVVVSCGYCESENRLISVEAERAPEKVARLAEATAEAEAMSTRLEARGKELEHRLTEAVRREDYAEALRCQEAILRLHHAPTIHIYRRHDPNDPQVAAALQQIDASIDGALRALAAQWGVAYTPAAERG